MIRVITIALVLLCEHAPVYSAAVHEAPLHAHPNELQQSCYAMAMVGLDSVINARLGVLPEHAVDLISHAASGFDNQSNYDSAMLNTILAAYLWLDSPHSYAVNVFLHCVQSQGYR
jgi:hypothetical protein